MDNMQTSFIIIHKGIRVCFLLKYHCMLKEEYLDRTPNLSLSATIYTVCCNRLSFYNAKSPSLTKCLAFKVLQEILIENVENFSTTRRGAKIFTLLLLFLLVNLYRFSRRALYTCLLSICLFSTSFSMCC